MRPVLVLHGVGNRDKEEEFTAQVETLAAKVSGELKLIHVYWGDLAAQGKYLHYTVPDVTSEADIRGEETGPGFGSDAQAALELLASAEDEEVRDPTVRADIVANAAAGSGMEVRGDASGEEIRDAVREGWSELTWLPQVPDEAFLEQAGQLLARIAAGAPSAGGDGGGEIEIRGGEAEVRGPVDWIKRGLKELDDFVGGVIGRVGGGLNHKLRTKFGPAFAGFAGDIIAYLSREDAIRKRVWDRIAAEAPGFGTREKPIGAVCHSLGGVILFDMIVKAKTPDDAGEPLYVDGLVTFGSQSPFFHALAARSQNLDEFTGEPVKVPDTLRGKWINLWEPLDVLAFVARPVFAGRGDLSIDDKPVAHQDGLWTHSVYWERQELVDAIGEAFRS